MQTRQIKAGAAGALIDFFARDASSSVGAGLSGLTPSTPGLSAAYHRDTAVTAVAIPLVAMSPGSHAAGGLAEVDATNLPGVYQLGLPNAATASGAQRLVIVIRGAANLRATTIAVDLLAVDWQDGLRGGLTALPAVVAGQTGGVALAGAAISLDDVLAAFTYGLDIAAAVSPATITLGASAATVDDYYNGVTLHVIMADTGARQTRVVVDYDGATRIATLHRPWTITPTGLVVYGLLVHPEPVLAPINHVGAELPQLATTLDRVGAFGGSGPNTILGCLRSLANKSASVATPADLTNGGDYNPQTDSLEARADAISIDPLANAVPGTYSPGRAGHALGRLGAGRVQVVAPISSDGRRLTLVRGDDYQASDGRAIEFLEQSANWPDLSGAAATLTVKFLDAAVSISAEIVIASGPSKKVRAQLSSSQTGSFPVVDFAAFTLEAITAAGHRITLARGAVTILEGTIP